MHLINEQVYARYKQYLEYCKTRLGLPLYSGSNDTLPFAKDNLASYPAVLAVWQHPEARLQLEFDKEDTELPFTITLACYPPDANLT